MFCSAESSMRKKENQNLQHISAQCDNLQSLIPIS